MKHIKLFEQFINEGSKYGLDDTEWSKWPNSKSGDVFISKRQGVVAVRDGNALRPLQSFKPENGTIPKDKAFATDKQFTAQIEPTAKAIADAHYAMWNKGLNTREKADKFGKYAEEDIKKLTK